MFVGWSEKYMHMEIRERFDGPEDMENAIVFETGRSWC